MNYTTYLSEYCYIEDKQVVWYNVVFANDEHRVIPSIHLRCMVYIDHGRRDDDETTRIVRPYSILTGNGGGGAGESTTKAKRISATKRKKVAKGRTAAAAAAATGVATKAKRKYTKRTVVAGEKKNKKTMKKPPPQKSLASTTATATATAIATATESTPNVPNETVAYLRDGNTSPPSSSPSVEADHQEKTRLLSLSNRKEKEVDAVHHSKNTDMHMLLSS